MYDIIGIFCSFPSNKKLSLPGVYTDRAALKSFATDNNLQYQELVDDVVTRSSIKSIFYGYAPPLIWICGHGVLDNDVNKFLMAEYGESENKEGHNNYIDNHFFSDIMLSSTSYIKTQVLILDYCHSGRSVNIDYFYDSGKYYKNINSKMPIITEDTDLLVAIAASSDYNPTFESANGGMLTQFLLSFLRKHGFLCLGMLDSEIHRHGYDFHLMTNKLICPTFKFLELVDKNKDLSNLKTRSLTELANKRRYRQF